MLGKSKLVVFCTARYQEGICGVDRQYGYCTRIAFRIRTALTAISLPEAYYSCFAHNIVFILFSHQTALGNTHLYFIQWVLLKWNNITYNSFSRPVLYGENKGSTTKLKYLTGFTKTYLGMIWSKIYEPWALDSTKLFHFKL